MRLLAALLLAGVAPHVITASSFGGIRLAYTTLPQARALFGAPTTTTRGPGSCIARWARAGLRVEFLTVGSDPGDPCRAAPAISASTTSRSSFRTSTRLRVGDPAAAISAAYPRATRHGSAYWLVTRRTCSLGGNTPYPALRATVADGRVASLEARTSICD